MDNYSTSSPGRRTAAKSSLKLPEIHPLSAREKRAEWRAVAAWEYYKKTGFISFDDKHSGAEPWALGYCAISARKGEKPHEYPDITSGVVRVYENDLEVKRPGARQRATIGTRGKIAGFSDRSRGRLMKFLNRLRWPPGACYFLSQTFTDNFPEPKEAKRLLRVLLKRMARRYPAMANLWRQELKRRKSGVNVGKIASHFHLFVWGITDTKEDFEAWLRDTWTELAGAENPLAHHEHGSNVRLVGDRKQACWYVSKYMEKSDDGGEIEAGRIWGHSKSLDASPVLVLVMSRLQLAVLRALVIAWGWAECKAIPSLVGFIGRLQYFPTGLGWHVYGMGVTVARSIVERALDVTGDIDSLPVAWEGTA